MSQKTGAPALDHVDHHLELKPTSTIQNASTRRAPISKLSDDVLFSIFSINSQIEMTPQNNESGIITEICYGGDTYALTTNRHSSQVCRRWRNIILSSPTIWANSLDIDVLDQPGDDWRTEVLKRTGKAPISLIGRMGFESSREENQATSFVLNILENEWDRIRYLSIYANGPDIVQQMFASLQKPAPNLEYLLYITTYPEDEEPQSFRSEDGIVLFSNISPKLRFLCSQGFAFDFVPSLSNLRKFWLKGYMASFTIQELYLGLQHLPSLEELFIDHNELLKESVGLSDNLPLINLPRLAEITINNPGTQFITGLLRYIVPAPGCRLAVSQTPLGGLDQMDIENLAQVYSTFIRNTADFRPVPYISLSYTENAGFAFRAADGPQQFNSPYPYINFAYSTNAWQDPSILNAFSLPIMKALASRPNLGRITKLDLELDAHTFASSNLEVITILSQLSSVSELTADLTTLLLLTNMQATSEFSLLPSTITIIVVSTSFGRTGINNPRDYLDPFLKGRMERGIPIRVLKLSKDNFSEDGRWDFLTEFQGLSVVWSGRSFWMEDDEMESSEE